MEPPRSHTDDPETSRAAAAKKLGSGTFDSDRALALHLVRSYEGRTIKELASLIASPGTADWERWRLRLARRLSELRQDGLVGIEGSDGECSRWWPTKPPQRPEPPSEPQGDLFPVVRRYRTD